LGNGDLAGASRHFTAGLRGRPPTGQRRLGPRSPHGGQWRPDHAGCRSDGCRGRAVGRTAAQNRSEQSRRAAIMSHETIGENVDPRESGRFDALAARWWDPEGELRTLHDINGPRVEYLAERVNLDGQ